MGVPGEGYCTLGEGLSEGNQGEPVHHAGADGDLRDDGDTDILPHEMTEGESIVALSADVGGEARDAAELVEIGVDIGDDEGIGGSLGQMDTGPAGQGMLRGHGQNHALPQERYGIPTGDIALRSVDGEIIVRELQLIRLGVIAQAQVHVGVLGVKGQIEVREEIRGPLNEEMDFAGGGVRHIGELGNAVV